MTLYFREDGTLCSILVGDTSHAPAPEATEQLEVDESTNEQILQITQTAPESLRYAAGQLMWNDEPLAVTEPGQGHVDRQMLPTIVGKVAAGEVLDADELQCALRCLLRAARLV